jgi:hypothetical protein
LNMFFIFEIKGSCWFECRNNYCFCFHWVINIRMCLYLITSESVNWRNSSILDRFLSRHMKLVLRMTKICVPDCTYSYMIHASKTYEHSNGDNATIDHMELQWSSGLIAWKHNGSSPQSWSEQTNGHHTAIDDRGSNLRIVMVLLNKSISYVYYMCVPLFRCY